MADALLDDRVWERVQPLLPPPPIRRLRHPGRKRVDDRLCLVGILYVLRTGIPWESLPTELGYGNGVTCWRRLREWRQAGVWDKVRRVLVNELRDAQKIDWPRAVGDTPLIRAVRVGERAWPKIYLSSPAKKDSPRVR